MFMKLPTRFPLFRNEPVLSTALFMVPVLAERPAFQKPIPLGELKEPALINVDPEPVE